MGTFLQDLRHAARRLLKSPGFSIAAVLTLALGVGANSAIFSVVDSVLLRPLPYQDADRVVTVSNSFAERERMALSAPELMDYREGIPSFQHLGAYRTLELNLTGDAEPERLAAAAVTANLFDALGTEAAVGRTFLAEEDASGRDDVVVLGHGLWQRRFGSDPSVVGSTVRLNGQPRTVVGVMPLSFQLPVDYETEEATQLWVPLALDPGDLGGRGFHNLLGVARLWPDATVERANAELARLTHSWLEDGIETLEDFTAFAEPVKEDVVGDVRPALFILFGAVGFVLLLACANVTNLLLVRADERQREIAVRAALGAGRLRVVSQLLTESLLLASIGAALGLLLAYVGVQVLVALNPSAVPRLDQVALDARVVAFTGGLALLTAVLFGALPALRVSRPDLLTPLKEGGRGSTRGRGGQRFRRTLVTAEIAVSVVLVIAAGLMIRSFSELQRIELGLDPENVLTFQLMLPAADYPENAEITGFYSQLVDQTRTLPGVRSAGGTLRLPLADRVGDWGVEIEGQPRPQDGSFAGYLQVVTPGFFETMGIASASGRLIEAADRIDGRPAVVISERMAERYWSGESALGKRLRISGLDGPWFTVVGVVSDIRHNAVADEPLHTMYFPHAQLPLVASAARAMTLVVKTTADPLAASGMIRETVGSMDPSLPTAQVRSMEQVVDAAFAEPRFTMLLLAVFAAVALALGAVGIYGVMAYAVSRRIHEVGIRMALGARTADVRRMVLREGAVLALAGLALGLPAAFASTRILASLLYQVSATDWLTFAAVAVLLSAVALVAAYLPARRAARVDPVDALRSG